MAAARPHLPGVTLVGSNRPSADVLATNELLAIGRTVPTGCAPGRQHFLADSCDIKGTSWGMFGSFCLPIVRATPTSGDHSTLALWHLSGLDLQASSCSRIMLKRNPKHPCPAHVRHSSVMGMANVRRVLQGSRTTLRSIIFLEGTSHGPSLRMWQSVVRHSRRLPTQASHHLELL